MTPETRLAELNHAADTLDDALDRELARARQAIAILENEGYTGSAAASELVAAAERADRLVRACAAIHALNPYRDTPDELAAELGALVTAVELLEA